MPRLLLGAAHSLRYESIYLWDFAVHKYQVIKCPVPVQLTTINFELMCQFLYDVPLNFRAFTTVLDTVEVRRKPGTLLLKI